ncbi:hypothetical protein CC78DRAFT_587702 [Lojkania enalia]|uniref:Uncharacterized protein n=1 Tax=Lojkania enalia TaxID=147567 RepID=A0A9P4JYC4_9PLEO|nr:hypothetical protein CC78DRAFT_587702 [Didymosphaeria enalia]
MLFTTEGNDTLQLSARTVRRKRIENTSIRAPSSSPLKRESRLEGPLPIWNAPGTLPERPKEVGPIFDFEHVDVPIVALSVSAHKINYASDPASGEPAARPDDIMDRYLLPSLTKNERLRLTLT